MRKKCVDAMKSNDGLKILRNILAYEYLDIKCKKISDFIQTGEQYFKSFVEAAKKFLEENPS